MDLVGYSDRWVVQPGERIGFHVSCAGPRFQAEIVRLIHGDRHPAGPGFKERPVEGCDLGGSDFAGAVQAIHTGSYGLIPLPDDALTGDWSVSLWLWPSLLAAGPQGVLGQAGRWSLALDDQGRLVFRVGEASAVIETPLMERHWVAVLARYSAADGRISLSIHRQAFSPLIPQELSAEASGPLPPGSAPLLLAAAGLQGDGRREWAERPYNGKIADIAIYDRWIDDTEWAALRAGETLADGLLLRPDFAAESGSRRLPDSGPHGLNGLLVNRPRRLVPGPRWNGQDHNPMRAPELYNAAYFHDDDLEDADWAESFALTIPEDLPSGVYAAKLTADETVDYLPFFVRRPTGKPTAKVAIQMPTVSYMVYGNEHLAPEAVGTMGPHRNALLHQAEYDYLNANALRSAYDRHNDGDGINFGMLKRPVLTSMRPDHHLRIMDCVHQFSADLHLVDWFDAKGIDVDIITDHDAHREGRAIYDMYNCVVTGTHHEYWTRPMLDALEGWLAEGGRLINLSGNGFYWVTALDDEDQSVAEISRERGICSWESDPGEMHLSLTGERGGMWLVHGRAPQSVTGVGMIAQGFDRGAGYLRSEQSDDPRAAFIFEGVDERVIGDFPNLVLGWGAGGFEIDRADPAFGTPAHALILASTQPGAFSSSYQMDRAVIGMTSPFTAADLNPEVRSDLVFFETPQDGAVFSAGSIAWCGCLSYNGYDNNVSRITENVVRAFSGDGALPQVP